MSLRILSISPRAEDFALACPATLSALAGAGHEVQSLCLESHEGYRAACRALGVGVTKQSIERALRGEWDIIISPGTRCGDPAHEAAAREVRGAFREGIWWQWALWSTLPRANIVFPFGTDVMLQMQENLHYFSPDLSRFLRGRAATTGASAAHTWKKPEAFLWAEALAESFRKDGHWGASPERKLNPQKPL